MERDMKFASLIILLISRKKRRQLIIEQLRRKEEAILKSIADGDNLFRLAKLQFEGILPSLFFSSFTPRFRRCLRLKRYDNYWRNLNNPGNEWLYFETFRMRSETFSVLCEKLKPFLPSSDNFVVEPLPLEKQIAVCIYKLASCAEYRVVGDVFGIHKSTVHKYFHIVVEAILKLQKEFIQFPNFEKSLEIANKFEERCHIPNIIGAIDSTHIPIVPPADARLDYINSKGWASIVLQGVVDNKCRFIDVSVKHPGNADDALVFKQSKLYKNAASVVPKQNQAINGISTPLFLIGDPAYPLLPWLMKPYVDALTEEEESFNSYLSTARKVVENAFTRLKGRWRCVCKRLDVDPKFVPKVVLACAILHNFVEQNKENFHENWHLQVAEIQSIYPQPVAPASTQVLTDENSVDPKVLRNNLSSYLKKNMPLRKSHLN